MTITVGTEVVLEGSTDATDGTNVIGMSATQAVAIWPKVAVLKGAVIDVSGVTPTVGTPKNIAGFSNAADYPSITKLTSTKAICVYPSSAADNPGKAVILDVVGGPTFNVGTEAEFSANEVTLPDVCALSATQALVVWVDQDDSSKVKGCVLDVSGSTITPGAIQTINAATLLHEPSVEMVNSTTAVVIYGDENDYPSANVLTVAASAITVGTKLVIEAVAGRYFGVPARKAIGRIDANRMLATYRSPFSSYKIKTAVLTISGTTLTAGALTTVTTAGNDGTYYSLIMCNSTKAFIVYSTGGVGYVFTLNVSSTATSNNDEISFFSSDPLNNSGALISDGTIIFVYTAQATTVYVQMASVPLGARFYQGAGTLAEKFTLPFDGVHPGAFTLDKPLGTIVIGSNAPAAQPIISSVSPYVTGTASSDNFPTGTAVTGLDWI